MLTLGPRIVRGCAALLLLLTVNGCGSPDALQPVSNHVKYGTPIVAVGSRNYFGFVDLYANGTQRVSLTGAHLLGLTSGLRVLGTYAVSVAETNKSGAAKHYIADLSEADIQRDYPGLRLHPVTDASIDPGKSVNWYVVFIVAPTRYGDFSSSGVEVDYQVGGDHGSQTYPGFEIEVRCGPVPATSPSPSGH